VQTDGLNANSGVLLACFAKGEERPLTRSSCVVLLDSEMVLKPRPGQPSEVSSGKTSQDARRKWHSVILT
jgi:hypothetical protein